MKSEIKISEMVYEREQRKVKFLPHILLKWLGSTEQFLYHGRTKVSSA